MNFPLESPTYTCISKRSKTVEVKYFFAESRSCCHVVIDTTGLKVYGKCEGKTRKHGKDKRRIWRKLCLAVDVSTHSFISAEISLVFVGDNEVLSTLLNLL